MPAYDKSYLNEIVETQGKLFSYIADMRPEADVEDFIVTYMASNTRKLLDKADAYLSNLTYKELFDYFCSTEKYLPKSGKTISGFMPDWIGEFYAFYQWQYQQNSDTLLTIIPLDFIKAAYYGLHDLDLKLAVQKVQESLPR